MTSPRSPGQRAGLTREHVLAAAADLLAERGAQALTMRAVAARLGVSPNALYSHVTSKQVLVDDLLDHALAAVSSPEKDLEPVAGVRAVMTSTYQVLLARADLVPLYLERRGARGPNARHLGDVVLELLARTGIDPPRAGQLLDVLIVHTIGAAAFAASPPPDGPPSPTWSSAENSTSFERGLAWILAGATGTR